jgi:hypothetical protein
MVRKQLVNRVSFDWLVCLVFFDSIKVSLQISILFIQLPPLLVECSQVLEQVVDGLAVLTVDLQHQVDVITHYRFYLLALFALW